MKTSFYNKSGQLSNYGFSCGYVEKKENKETRFTKQMYKEHNCFHVKVSKDGFKAHIWETFDSNELTKARKFYNSIKI
jgi:hypothetical protein